MLCSDPYSCWTRTSTGTVPYYTRAQPAQKAHRIVGLSLPSIPSPFQLRPTMPELWGGPCASKLPNNFPQTHGKSWPIQPVTTHLVTTELDGIECKP